MNTYKRHRFPPDIISYAVWLYYRFNLSHRDIKDLLAERGVTVSRLILEVLYSRSREVILSEPFEVFYIHIGTGLSLNSNHGTIFAFNTKLPLHTRCNGKTLEI